MSFFSLLLALVIAALLLPLFNQLAGKQMSVLTLFSSWLFPVLIALIIVVGCIAGSYPAFYLSSFQPVQVLKGSIAKGFKSSWLRSGLVVFQFFISITLIIGTIVIYNQLKYIQNKDLGYDRDHVLIVNQVWTLGNKAKTFKQEVKQLAGVKSVTMTGFLPTSGYNNNSSLFKDPVLDSKRAIQSSIWNVDEDYIPTLGVKMKTGRNFSVDMKTDSSAIIINEAAAQLLGFSNPINQLLYLPMDNKAKVMKPFHIIGVIKDFNFKSLRENVTPLVLFDSEDTGALSIRINSANIPALLAQVKDKWRAVSPNLQISYSFMDEDFDNNYRTEQRIGQIAISFTSLAIIIACLGLFGLAAYAAEQRTKEIGIRKVLGASISGLVGMLSKDFIMLVLIAILISSPLAWWFMTRWFLQSFAYHQPFQWWVVMLAGVSAVLIAFITISFQSIKAALTNPVKSLRSE